MVVVGGMRVAPAPSLCVCLPCWYLIVAPDRWFGSAFPGVMFMMPCVVSGARVFIPLL